MKNSCHLAILSSVALTLFIATSCAPKNLTRVAVMGDANLQAQPDTAVVILSVITQSKQAVVAQQENARKSDAVINAVKTTAGSNPEIKTSDYRLQPQQTYSDNRMPSIIGYEARNTVSVRMYDINQVGAVIDAASRAGANSVESVSFILREDNAARGQTLAEATRQAMIKAQSIAQALGGRIVRVVEEHEAGATNRPPTTDYNANMSGEENMALSSAYKSAARYATPVEAGALNVRSQVQLVVEIEARP
ncbi:MAG TPA: SIMPL domain-containing protein [Pyrinomonadaceae bacterium]|jgi:hypothetical protein